ncbi:hypothetical protein ACHWQZ_G008405 [Mnemiopsis leidyi]
MALFLAIFELTLLFFSSEVSGAGSKDCTKNLLHNASCDCLKGKPLKEYKIKLSCSDDLNLKWRPQTGCLRSSLKCSQVAESNGCETESCMGKDDTLTGEDTKPCCLALKYCEQYAC